MSASAPSLPLPKPTETERYACMCRAQKGHFLGPAAKEGIAILFPDTSPRGAGVEGETDSWDFGVGASLRFASPPMPPGTYRFSRAAAGARISVDLVFRLWSEQGLTRGRGRGIDRRGFLPERDEPEVGEALQHAHAHHRRAPAGHRGRRDPCRMSLSPPPFPNTRERNKHTERAAGRRTSSGSRSSGTRWAGTARSRST